MRFGLKLPSSLVGRIFLASVGVLVAVMAAVGVLILAMLRWGDGYLTEQQLRSDLREVKQALVLSDSGGPPRLDFDHDRQVMQDGLQKDIAFRLIDGTTGQLVASSPAGPALALLQLHGLGDLGKVQVLEQDDLRLLTLAQSFSRGGRNYTAQVARSERMIWLMRLNENEIAAQAMAATALFALLAFGAMVLWTVRYMLKPVQAASAVAAAITPENLAARLDASGLPSELRPMIDAFNAALHRLQIGYTVQQQFLAAAAHELKTPLALLRGELELSTIENRAALLADVDHMVRQVHQLLQLAEVSELRNFSYGTDDLRVVLREAMQFLSRIARRHEVDLQMELPEQPVIRRADRGMLFVLVKNLVENAIFHSEASKLVTIALDAQGFRVRDEGVGIPLADMPHLFERFWRGPGTQRPGAGLGLAICAEICKAHGWGLHARNCQPGAEFSVCFEPQEGATQHTT